MSPTGTTGAAGGPAAAAPATIGHSSSGSGAQALPGACVVASLTERMSPCKHPVQICRLKRSGSAWGACTGRLEDVTQLIGSDAQALPGACVLAPLTATMYPE